MLGFQAIREGRGRRRMEVEGYLVPGAGLEPARGFPQGIFVPLQLSPLPARACIRGLDFTFALPGAAIVRSRIRQGPSSLYTFPGRARKDSHQGLARYCSHPDVLLFHRL